MKVTNSFHHRDDSLRVKVLRKTVPKSYFKQKARLIKIMTRQTAIQLMNEFKEASKNISIVTRGKKRKNDQERETTTPKKKQICPFENYKLIAVNIMKRFSGNEEKNISVDEKSGKVAKLLYM